MRSNISAQAANRETLLLMNQLQDQVSVMEGLQPETHFQHGNAILAAIKVPVKSLLSD
jgi:hypothetical protein